MIVEGENAYAKEQEARGVKRKDIDWAGYTPPTSELTRKHFEEAYANSRKSVSAGDIAKYDAFRIRCDPTYVNKSGIATNKTKLIWPNDTDDDDMHAEFIDMSTQPTNLQNVEAPEDDLYT